MTNATLTTDLTAISQNWQALDALTRCETAAVVKADAYGLGLEQVACHLAATGARIFFVALASEGAALRRALGGDAEIYVFAGHMRGDTDLIRDNGLTPLLNSPEQLTRHQTNLADHAYGLQLDTGMNRLGLEPEDWLALDHGAISPTLVMSHLACADDPDHPMNRQQLACFNELTEGLGYRRSLSATGGILLGGDYHFDLTRPGIGLYGGQPFDQARPVVTLSLPVIQTRLLQPGETVGYGNSWTAGRPTRLATVAAGYADGLLRALGNRGQLFAGGTACPLVGRVSMDLITVDVTELAQDPESLDILCPQQTVDQLADAAGTIGYEILTSLGPRYTRHTVKLGGS